MEELHGIWVSDGEEHADPVRLAELLGALNIQDSYQVQDSVCNSS